MQNKFDDRKFLVQYFKKEKEKNLRSFTKGIE